MYKLLIFHLPFLYHVITSIGLRLSNEEIRIAVAHRLGCRAREPLTNGCGKTVDVEIIQSVGTISTTKNSYFTQLRCDNVLMSVGHETLSVGNSTQLCKVS